jgi:lipoprotein NlpI
MTAAQPATHTPGSKLTFLFFEMLAMMQSFRCPVRGCGVRSKGRDTKTQTVRCENRNRQEQEKRCAAIEQDDRRRALSFDCRAHNLLQQTQLYDS